MPWTAWKLAGSASQVSTGQGWSNINEILADDDTTAFVDVKAQGSRILFGKDFGFTDSDISSNATIIGVEVEMEIRAWCTSGTSTFNYSVGLSIDNGSTTNTPQTGSYVSAAATEGAATPDVATFSGKFGTALSYDEIVNGSANFGAWIQVDQGIGSVGDEKFSVDYIKARVAWDYPGGGMIGDI